jgi:hypothetical protein
MDRGPITDFIFKSLTFLRHVSMKAIDNCLKLKLSGIGSSTLVRYLHLIATLSFHRPLKMHHEVSPNCS